MTIKLSKTLTTALAVLSIIPSTHAEVLNKLYISGAIGLNLPEDADFDWPDLAAIPGSSTHGDFDLSNTANFAEALGLKVMPNIRVEAEASYRKSDLEKTNLDGIGDIGSYLSGVGLPADTSGDLKTWAFLFNGYYDFITDSKFSPYLSGGIGAAHHKGKLAISGYSEDASDTVIAYQIGAGINYELDDKTTIFGGYRYLGSSNADLGGIELEYATHELRAGIRYAF